MYQAPSGLTRLSRPPLRSHMLAGKQRDDVYRHTRFHFSTTRAMSLATVSSPKSVNSPISGRRSSAVEKCIARTKAQPSDSGFVTR